MPKEYIGQKTAFICFCKCEIALAFQFANRLKQLLKRFVSHALPDILDFFRKGGYYES